MAQKIFISYSREDIKIAQEINSCLKNEGIDTFFDIEKIKLSELWPKKLEENISKCDIFLLLWSESASKSKWVEMERSSALIHENKTIISVCIDDTELPDFNRIYQAIKLKEVGSISNACDILIRELNIIYEFPKMVKIEGGTFLMGDRFDDFLVPQHEVKVNDFFISQCVITRKQYYCSMDDYSSEMRIDNPDYPMTWISWNDAQKYCDWIFKKTKKKYRLPTEAEWEYACRAGSEFDYSKNVNIHNLYEYAWYNQNSLDLCAPGKKKPTLFGLYDMHGLVWEWCSSLFKDYPYKSHDSREDLLSKGNRVIRGGSYLSNANELTCHYRIKNLGPNGLQIDLGFRVIYSD